MKKTFLFLFILSPSYVFAQVITQCYIENLSKAPVAATCINEIRASGKIVTEGDVFMCNIKTGLLTPTKCPDESEK